MIALLDYGSGNLRSVYKALVAVGADVEVLKNPERIPHSRGVVLPGVGAFDDCMGALRRQQLLEGVRESIKAGRPFLGICVGYQALFEKSEEFNSCAAGLGIFPGKVIRFPSASNLKVPQIGWNQIEIQKPECPLYRGVRNGAHVYFVHSYFPKPEQTDVIATVTEYGPSFASSVWKDHVFATQFHPEKSQAVGLKVLANFVEFCARN